MESMREIVRIEEIRKQRFIALIPFHKQKVCGKQSESRVERERDMRKLDCILINESEDI
jgi:hypothetical protein